MPWEFARTTRLQLQAQGSADARGARVQLERAFNVCEGFTRKDDTLPPRVVNEPIREGPSQGSLITREELDEMLDDYYEARGWDEDGMPTRAKLEELVLKDIADDFVNM